MASTDAHSGPSQGNRPVNDIVDRIDALTDQDCISLRDMVEAFGERSFLPVLMVPALLVFSPLSGIPLFSSFCGIMIAFIAGQMVFSRSHLWLPGFIMNREVTGKKAHNATQKMRKVADFLDKHAKSRWGLMTSRPFRKTVQAICFLCGCAMPFLELVPFSSSILGAAVLFLSTALLARDGLFVVFGLATITAAVFVPLFALGIL